MPTQATIRKIGVNPFAIAASKGLKRGTPEYERVVEGITRRKWASNDDLRSRNRN
jgi:hypothetical protein